MYSLKAVPSTVIASASSVPSMSALPLMSSVAASSSPVNVMFLKLPMSLLLSTTTALLAVTVPAVKSSICSMSASEIAALPIVRVPDKSKLPFMSMVVAFISISVSDTRSSTPSAL